MKTVYEYIKRQVCKIKYLFVLNKQENHVIELCSKERDASSYQMF